MQGGARERVRSDETGDGSRCLIESVSEACQQGESVVYATDGDFVAVVELGAEIAVRDIESLEPKAGG
jgi:hypothetical protein